VRLRTTCRHGRLTEGLRRFSEERLGRLSRFVDEPASAHLILVAGRTRHEAELVVRSPLGHFSGAGAAREARAAIGLVAERVEKQLRRERRRRTDGRRLTTRPVPRRLAPEAPAEPHAEVETVATLAHAEARAQLPPGPQAHLLYRERRTGALHILRRLPGGGTRVNRIA